jgi:hypothetical protein
VSPAQGSFFLILRRRIGARAGYRPHRLGTEHKRIIVHTFAIDLGFQSQITQPVQAGFRLILDAAVEQTHSGKIARVLQRATQSHGSTGAAVIILWRPITLIASAADRRERDGLVLNKGIGLQARSQRREIAQRFYGGRRRGMLIPTGAACAGTSLTSRSRCAGA